MKRKIYALLGIVTGATFLWSFFPGGVSHRNWRVSTVPVGRVLVSGHPALCRGSLVGEDLVMTAAHCVTPVGAGRPVAPSQISFTMSQGRLAGSRLSIRDVAVIPGFRRGPRPDRSEIAKDVALLRLTKPVSVLPDSISSSSSPDLGMLSQGRGQAPGMETCKTAHEGSGVMTLSCSRAPGASGSPVYGIVAGRRQLVGVVSAGGRRGKSPVVFAVSPAALMSEFSWQSSGK